MYIVYCLYTIYIVCNQCKFNIRICICIYMYPSLCLLCLCGFDACAVSVQVSSIGSVQAVWVQVCVAAGMLSVGGWLRRLSQAQPDPGTSVPPPEKTNCCTVRQCLSLLALLLQPSLDQSSLNCCLLFSCSSLSHSSVCPRCALPQWPNQPKHFVF